MSSNTVSTAGSPSQVISRADARAQNVAPSGPLQMQQHIIGAAVLLERAAQAFAVREIVIVVGGREADRLLRSGTPNISDVRLLIATTAVIAQAADDRGKRTDIEKMFERTGRHRWCGPYRLLRDRAAAVRE